MPNGYNNNIFSSKRFMCSNLGFFSRQILRLDGIVYQRSSALTQCAKKGMNKNVFFFNYSMDWNDSTPQGRWNLVARYGSCHTNN